MIESSATKQIRSTGRRILIGILTIAPLGITWFIMDFLFAQLSRFGRPWISGIAGALRPTYPDLAGFLVNETFQSMAGVLIVLVFLYVLGWAAGRVIGQKLIEAFESIIGLIPVVDTIYRATKRFISVAGTSQDSPRRVVLINFPSPEMKTVGLVTRMIRDSGTGEELAAVYVPTAPNPTSGYIEIVPLKNLIFTDWTFDQAMAFIVTGGSNAPETVNFHDKGASRNDPGTTYRDGTSVSNPR